MPMLHRDGSPKATLAWGAAAVSIALVGTLAGCSMQAEDQLPATHLDQGGEVAASHDRCGACHRNGTRGNGVYDPLEYTGIESLPASEFALEALPADANAAESLYGEPVEEEGVQ